jgi:hypothetical protein
MSRICCIKIIGVPLTDSAAEAIYLTSCRMIKKGNKKCKIKHDDVEGELHTEFEAVNFAGMSGYQFYGDIETKRGSTKIIILGREEDFDESYELRFERINVEEKPRPKKKAMPKYLANYGDN